MMRGPASVPEGGGPYWLKGLDAAGEALFSFDFTPYEMDHGGGASFAFLIPYQPLWEGRLERIVLSGPEGTVTLDRDSNIPMAILRNPQTGQVRGILRDPPLASEAAADAVGVGAPGLEVLFSRGIPGAAAWRR